MMIALATGIFYFTWVVTGLSVSLSLMILIIGIPLALLFLGSVRVLSFLEGYLVQGLLGAQLRSPGDFNSEIIEDADNSDVTIWMRIKAMLSDVRTWTSMIYMVLQLGLGILYFTFAVTALTVSISFIVAPLLQFISPEQFVMIDAHALEHLSEDLPWLANVEEPSILSWALLPIGIVFLFLTMHIARGVGYLHRHIAEALLVQR